MNCLSVTVFAVLCLGIVYARHGFLRREKIRSLDISTNIFQPGDGDETSKNAVDMKFSLPDFYDTIVKRYFLLGLTINEMECSCEGYKCDCCCQLNFRTINRRNKACLSIAYLADHLGIEAELTIDGIAIMNKDITADNPPAICASLPFAARFSSLCFRFTNLEFHNTRFSGCVALEVRVYGNVWTTIDLGCL